MCVFFCIVVGKQARRRVDGLKQGAGDKAAGFVFELYTFEDPSRKLPEDVLLLADVSGLAVCDASTAGNAAAFKAAMVRVRCLMHGRTFTTITHVLQTQGDAEAIKDSAFTKLVSWDW
jgi:hypothetical protein